MYGLGTHHITFPNINQLAFCCLSSPTCPKLEAYRLVDIYKILETEEQQADMVDSDGARSDLPWERVFRGNESQAGNYWLTLDNSVTHGVVSRDNTPPPSSEVEQGAQRSSSATQQPREPVVNDAQQALAPGLCHV